MFSKPAESRSIASQLVFRFTVAGAFLLGVGLIVLYLIVVRHAFEEDNIFLRDRISALRADLKNVTGPNALREQLRVPHSGKNLTYWIRVLDSDGRSIAETPGMGSMLPSAVFPAAQSTGTITSPKDYRTQGRLFYLAATSEKANGYTYAIQVGQDRTVDEEFTHEFGALTRRRADFRNCLVCGDRSNCDQTRIASTVGTDSLRSSASGQRICMSVHRRQAGHDELQPLAAAFDGMLDRLEDSFTRLSQFSADIAHELRTPIANIRGEAEVALTRPRTPNEYREVIESNVSECERLSGIIDNLLFLARAEAAEGHIQCTSIDGRSEVAKIASFYEAVAEEQQVTITCAGDGSIYADPILFGRAVSNLVENALRFTPAGGRIEISIETNSAESKVSVSDTGCGIAKEHLPRVFDRFYRVDPSRSSVGAGLGLSLVKSITDLHGGSATVKSEINRGTIVTVTFPKASVAASTPNVS